MDAIFPAVDPKKCLKTYGKLNTTQAKTTEDFEATDSHLPKAPVASDIKWLTTKDALEFLVDGTLKSKVCRYCLNVASTLSHLDQILQVANKENLYSVAIKDMVACFYPLKVADDPNMPDKICEKCLDRAIISYLFTQQCEQTERALKNCFEDIYDKISKLDPIEKTKKRGRQKLHPNHNKVLIEHKYVIDYAEPIINLINTTPQVLTTDTPISDLECLKCCEIFPNLESLMNHTKTHPATMWYNCRLCGHSFAKRYHLKKHFISKHGVNTAKKNKLMYTCQRCGISYEKCYDYLQHIEKHRFKKVMEHLVEKKMDQLCILCFNKGYKMSQLHDKINLSGICSELNGERNLATIMASTLPEMNLESHSGTKICQVCVNNALTSYVFKYQSYFARSRLNTCVSAMLDQLNTVTVTNKNICIEIANSVITNIKYDETVENNDDNKIDVLEDEFRVKSEDESELETNKEIKNVDKPKLLNGYKVANEVCSQFLTFKKKKAKRTKFTCPVCFKHFISDYFLKRHCLKHIPKKVQCNLCDAQLESKFFLYEHKKITHILKSNVNFSCETCGRNYVEKENLEIHKKWHKDPKCQICIKKFSSQKTYICHINRHIKKIATSMRKFKQFCSFCEKDCSNDNEFSLHVNKVHLQIKPYSCDMCERSYYTEYNLKCHRKIHNVYSKELCEFCNKILYSRKKLVVHIRKHIGDTPFFCQICNQSFYTQSLLKKHLALRHGGSYFCKICKVTFVSKKELKLHTNKEHSVF